MKGAKEDHSSLQGWLQGLIVIAQSILCCRKSDPQIDHKFDNSSHLKPLINIR